MSDTTALGLLLLGTPAWRSGQGLTPWPAERRLQMLAWLAHHGEWVGRDQLAALLWPGHERSAAQRNLRKQLFRLRELPDLPPVHERGRMLRWAVPTDVQQFEAALHAGNDAAAVALWRGLPWQGLDADAASGDGGLGEWLAAERTRLLSLWRSAMLRLAQAEPLQAAALAQDLLRADPLDEQALQVLMRSHLQGGRRAEAAAVYAQFAQALQHTLQLQPGAQSLALLRQASEGAPEPAAATDANPDFIGRVAELLDLHTLLARPGCHWLTVMGAGGSGKTRLLRTTFAAGLAAHRPWRVWVDLEDLSDTDLALRRVAAACGQDPAEGSDVLQALSRTLAERSALLVLDNLEQLPDAALRLARALAACPGVQVVATSRVRLGVPGEHLLALSGLPWPQPEDADRALDFDAVKLFVLHAQRHCTGFKAAAQSLAVARLCAFVEGNPLALLLAAPWTRHLPVAAILTELQRGATGLLGGAHSGEPARQYSIEASFDYSWGLLTPAEREALARLAVFRGSFTLDAAQEVSAAPLPVLAALLDKSLVQGADPATGAVAARFSLHPLVALFARGRTGPHAEAAAEVAHMGHFMRWLARFPPATQMAARDAFHQAAHAESGNLQSAWFRAVQRGEASALERAAAGWTALCYAAGQMNMGLQGLRAAKDRLAPGSLARARLSTVESWLCVNQGDLHRALEEGRSALARLRRGEDPQALLRCRQVLAGAMSRAGKIASSQRIQESLLRHYMREQQHQQAANILYELAVIDQRGGRAELALARNSQAVQLLRQSGLHSDLITLFQGRLQRLHGQARAAMATIEALLQQRARAMPKLLRSEACVTLAQACLDAGDRQRASELDALARELDSEGESAHWSATLALCSGRLALALGQAGTCHQRLCAAAALLAGQDWQLLEQDLACDTAAWLLAAGQADAAHSLLAGLLGQPLRDADTQARALQLHGRRRARRGVSREDLLAQAQVALHAAQTGPQVHAARAATCP